MTWIFRFDLHVFKCYLKKVWFYLLVWISCAHNQKQKQKQKKERKRERKIKM